MKRLFGPVDRNAKGDIGSSYPAWYFGIHLEELKESIAKKERALERGDVPEDHRPYASAELRKEREKLNSIEASRPKIIGKELDDLASTRKEIGDKVAESLFTHDQMKSGRVSPHKEAERMTKPVIKVTSDKMAEACKECGVTIKGDCITRNEASRVWKILSKYLDEETNVEVLRK